MSLSQHWVCTALLKRVKFPPWVRRRHEIQNRRQLCMRRQRGKLFKTCLPLNFFVQSVAHLREIGVSPSIYDQNARSWQRDARFFSWLVWRTKSARAHGSSHLLLGLISCVVALGKVWQSALPLANWSVASAALEHFIMRAPGRLAADKQSHAGLSPNNACCV